MKKLRFICCLLALIAAQAPWDVQARDAAFLDPGASTLNGGNDNAIRVEPKSDIDIGETVPNVARRSTIFLVNQTNVPVQIQKIAVNSDSNVKAEITSDDCSKLGTLASLSRCDIEFALTPDTSGGPWSVEVLITHNGAGRITRIHFNGKTTGNGGQDKKEMGLAVSAKEVKPVDFGDVTVGEGKVVRSTLMVNDSPDPITLYSIDVIEADNGLTRLDQGCAVDMELKPGESCPVTMLWAPGANGQISTDLIIRHSGRVGFAVIPLRGKAHGGPENTGQDTGRNGKYSSRSSGGSTSIAPPPSAQELSKANLNFPTVSASALGGGVSDTHKAPVRTAPSPDDVSNDIHLIGTVGDRAVIVKPDGSTAVARVGDTVAMDDIKAKVVTITPKTLTLSMNGKSFDFQLEASHDLIERAKSTQESSKTSAANGGGPAPPSVPGSATQLPKGQ
ncbi:MAG: hypothetical protein JO126_06775 [Alphaproteobacteria bacterium]|nr:hypothetical protein [Alphaproteobacteria bacterium]MBV8549142.1 hypothetical protein [Alphaproteobacteria bacterium]